jgi:hypothetical protein
MRLSLGITGHRESNAAYHDNRVGVEEALVSLFDAIEQASDSSVKSRLHALLSPGADLLGVEIALGRGWQVAAPLPFGKRLNAAINAHPSSAEEALALIGGATEVDTKAAATAKHILSVAERVSCMELAERDQRLEKLFLDSLREPADPAAHSAFSIAASERATLAGRVMIEQIDLLVAVWDGHSPGPPGGTRHTIARALEIGVGVIWIDAGNPAAWRFLDSPEALAGRLTLPHLDGPESVAVLLGARHHKSEAATGMDELDLAAPPARSSRRFHAYRRVEAIFDAGFRALFRPMVQHYASEEELVALYEGGLLGSAKALRGTDKALIARTEEQVVRRFARADAKATFLSDAYRGGMVSNLLLAAFAVIGGVAYLPLTNATLKWPFALFEFSLLATILLILAIGRKRDWHGRWFQTRRVAEYLRHAPFMLLLGVSRPAAFWPHGADSSWPEDYVRSILRETGLPNAVVDVPMLRTALTDWIGAHVSAQRSYHVAKARRLERIHHRLERISELLFLLAMLVVATYLTGFTLAAAGVIPEAIVHKGSKITTFLGIALPALGSALAGIHYFADFGRFAAISESTATRLGAVEARIATLLAAPDEELDYRRVADLARAVDETVVAEIEHWQDVFGGKHISVPV